MNTMKNIFWGIILVVFGLIWGLNALDITHINIFFNGWWTLFIIIPCFIGLFNDKDKTGNIIGLLIGIALLLCCFVIYNLTNMNISERKREIATLSVLGYNDLEVCSYIYREILIMGLLGIIVGIPSGCALLHFVFSLLKFGSIKNVTIIYYILTVVLVIVFILVVDLLLIKKITKIDMMTSLKDRE